MTCGSCSFPHPSFYVFIFRDHHEPLFGGTLVAEDEGKGSDRKDEVVDSDGLEASRLFDTSF